MERSEADIESEQGRDTALSLKSGAEEFGRPNGTVNGCKPEQEKDPEQKAAEDFGATENMSAATESSSCKEGSYENGVEDEDSKDVETAVASSESDSSGADEDGSRKSDNKLSEDCLSSICEVEDSCENGKIKASKSNLADSLSSDVLVKSAFSPSPAEASAVDNPSLDPWISHCAEEKAKNSPKQESEEPEKLSNEKVYFSEEAKANEEKISSHLDAGEKLSCNNSTESKEKSIMSMPTPVFEDITDDEDDSDGDVGGDNIELELDDLIEPADISKDHVERKLSPIDEIVKLQDQEDSSMETNASNPVITENECEAEKKEEISFTKLKPADSKPVPRQKVTARKSGRPVSLSESAPLKTINLHPIKDITMKLSDVEGALYLPPSNNAGSPAEPQGLESRETSSTENSMAFKPSIGGRKKRRKKSYDLPGCKKKVKKIRSDVESLGSSADSVSLADSVSDGDYQDTDACKDMSILNKDTIGAKLENSSAQVFGAKVESALDILTKNSHLGFAKKPKLHPSTSLSSSSSPSPSLHSTNTTQPSRKSLFTSKHASSSKNHGKIKSVLDMLHRRSQQRAESGDSTGNSPDSSSSSQTKSTANIGTSDGNGNDVVTCKQGPSTTTTTICVTSSESSTTTTIMVSPNKPIVEGMKRKGTPRKRREEVICLSDSDDSDEKQKFSNEGKKRRNGSLDSSAGGRPMTVLTSPSSSLLGKSKHASSPAVNICGSTTPTPVVMVVAQHSTAAGMRSLLPQHSLLQAGTGGVVMQGGKVVRPPAGSSLLPVISTLPIGAKAVNLAGMTAVPITSLANMPGSAGQQTVTLFGPISAGGAGGTAVPLSGANIVNISGSKHLVYSPAPLQAQPGGKVLTNKNSTSLLGSSALSISSSSPVVSQILLAAPKLSPSPNSKLTTGSASKAASSAQSLPPASASSTSPGNNLESLRALLVGKPVSMSPAGRASSSSSSLLPSTPMLFQMVTTSGSSLVPIPAQPVTLTSAQSPLKPVQQQQSLLPSTVSSGGKSSSSYSLVKPHVPNGVSCLTPPKTPDTDGSSEVAAAATLSRLVTSQTETSEVIPLCCCKINGTSYGKLSTGTTYCQALDTVDNKIMGCFNKVSSPQLVRPGIKIPFMAICEAHRRRLKLHQCCPGCGHFCTKGKFLQCRKDGKQSVHTFHKQCMFYRGGKYLCPHCGEECNQGQVELEVEHATDGVPLEVGPRAATKRDAPGRKTARIGRGFKKTKWTNNTKEENVTLPNNKVIDIGAIPLGPDQQTLTKLCKCAIEDRPKKYRTLAKDLYTPASEGDVEKVFYLLMDGMNPNARYDEQEGQTAMHAAATSGSLGTVVLLQQFGGEIHAQDQSLRTPMMCAAETGHVEVVKFLNKAGAKVEDRGEDGMTSLHYAAKSGHIDIIKYILSTERLNVNIEDDGGWTPIIWATESQLLDVVKFLTKNGGDPNKKDNEENTGLHWAAFSGSLEISEVFLDMGCELDSPNEHGDRPLHIAARQDHYDIVVLLLARGANVDLKNNKEETPVECCLNKGGQVSLALKVNQQLRGFAARKLIQPERLVERDITMGREKNPIACVNSEDDEPCPTDYLYVTHNVETSWLNINCIVTSLQSCRCKDDCSSMYCVCGRSSIKCWYDKMGRLLEEVNLLEPPLVFECNRACRCLINCNNRVVQNGITCRLQMFRTNGRGWGVRTLMDIPKGTFVCEYIGELISDSEADIREDDSYLFDLDNKDGDTYCIDARKYGNISRFINHLCEPNLVPVKVFVEHQDLRFPRICLFSSKDISAYEELGFDYGEKFWMIKWKFFTCACKSSKCKYSSETIKKTLEDYKLRYPDEQVD